MSELAAILFFILFLVAGIFFIIWFFKCRNLEKLVAERDFEITRIRNETQSALNEAQALGGQQIEEYRQYAEQIQTHYDAESKRLYDQMMVTFQEQSQRIEMLQRFEPLANEEEEVRHSMVMALRQAELLTVEAKAMVESAQSVCQSIEAEANERVREIYSQADVMQNQATSDAQRILKEAHKNAEEIAGDAYAALRDKEQLEKTVRSIQNVIQGYGDRYIIPAHSLLDDLAEGFGHTEAGRNLTNFRKYSRDLVEQGYAGTCEYVEANRRETAIRFVVDAFNGRVDAVLSRVKHDNYGTLEQEIKDAFNLVNQNGRAFKDARVLEPYLDSRLAELSWATVTQELKRKEREEQRQIKEQMREEEKARREYEKAQKAAQKEEQLINQAMVKAAADAAQASAEDRAEFETQLETLKQQLAEAEAKNERALSMAQQTRTGHVYIISNEGSFGEGVLKIGMTRRLEPLDRVKELGDASVPFEFDIHAMIRSEDAPTLEKTLHHEFHEMRLNKVNFRKEFFRIPIQQVRDVLAGKGVDVSFTMLADAREFRETQAIERMTPEDRHKYFSEK